MKGQIFSVCERESDTLTWATFTFVQINEIKKEKIIKIFYLQNIIFQQLSFNKKSFSKEKRKNCFEVFKELTQKNLKLHKNNQESHHDTKREPLLV